jgi:hypothetical protein
MLGCQVGKIERQPALTTIASTPLSQACFT